MTRNSKSLLQRIDWMIIRELLIKCIIITPFLFVIAIIIQYEIIIQEIFQLTILNVVPLNKYNLEISNDFSSGLAILGRFLFLIILMFLSFFIATFRASWNDFWKFCRRIYRATYIALFLITMAIIFLFIGLFITGLDDPDSSIFPLLASLSSGLGTEILGAFLLFLLLEVFAKTWEENEEAEYAEQRNNLNDTHKQLEAVLVRWQQSKLECNNQAKQISEKSVFNRLLSPQKMPSAYYEGQAHALDLVIKDIQNLMPELDTPASDNSDKII